MTGTVVEHGAFYGSPAGFQFTSLAMFDGSVERCGTGTFVVWFPLLRGGPTPFRGDLEVVEGSGTGGLTGISGRGRVHATPTPEGTVSRWLLRLRCETG